MFRRLAKTLNETGFIVAGQIRKLGSPRMAASLQQPHRADQTLVAPTVAPNGLELNPRIGRHCGRHNPFDSSVAGYGSGVADELTGLENSRSPVSYEMPIAGDQAVVADGVQD